LGNFFPRFRIVTKRDIKTKLKYIPIEQILRITCNFECAALKHPPSTDFEIPHQLSQQKYEFLPKPLLRLCLVNWNTLKAFFPLLHPRFCTELISGCAFKAHRKFAFHCFGFGSSPRAGEEDDIIKLFIKQYLQYFPFYKKNDALLKIKLRLVKNTYSYICKPFAPLV